MSKTAFVGVRVEPELKAEVEQICEDLGLTLSQAITLFLKQVQYHRGLPFEVRMPSPATLRALREARDREELDRYDSPDDLYEDLDL